MSSSTVSDYESWTLWQRDEDERRKQQHSSERAPVNETDGYGTRRRSIKDMVQSLQPSSSKQQAGMSREGIYEAFAQADKETDGHLKRKPSVGPRRKSLIGSFDLKLGRSKSRQQEQKQPVPPPPPEHAMPVPSSSIIDDAGATGVDYDYYQPALRAPFIPQSTSSSSIIEQRNPSMDSNISKVSTFELNQDELYTTISTAQNWLDQQDKGKRRPSNLDDTPRNDDRSKIDQEQMLYMNSTTHLRPRARSLRDKLRPEKPKEEEPRLYGSVRASRSRSRVLRSPPPPQTDAVDDVPPSLPNVDVRQIKHEIDTPHIAQPPPRGSSLNPEDASDKHLTVNVINNVKRRLSFGKERSKSAAKETDFGRKSLPANFHASREPRKRTLSSGSTLRANNTANSDQRRKSGSNGAADRTSANEQRQSARSSVLSRRTGTSPPPLPAHSNAAGIALISQSQEDLTAGRQQLIPPVPPVPRHHSLAPSDIPSSKRSSKRESGSRASSSSSTGRGGISGDEQHAEKKTPRHRVSGSSFFGDMEDNDAGDRRVTRTKKSMTEDTIGNAAAKSPRASKEPGFTLWRPNKQQELARPAEHTKDGGKKGPVSTRKRGKTLPGSLATPPPIPTAPLPPMKVEPINMMIPEGAMRKRPAKSPSSNAATTPTRIPMAYKNSLSAATTPVGVSGTSSEEEIVYGSDMKARRRKPEQRLSRSKSGEGKSSRISSSTAVSPKVRPKHTSSSTTTNSSDGGKTSAQKHVSGKYESPRLGAQTTTESSRTRKSSTAGSLGRATSLHVPATAGRKNSITSNDDATEKVRPRTISLHEKLQTMVEEHPIDEAFYGASSTALNEIAASSQHNSIRDDSVPSASVSMPSTTRRASESAVSGDDRRSQEHSSLRAPKSPNTILKYYIQFLSHYEQKEVRKYEHIYFTGPHAKKIKGTPDNPILNYGYDDDRGDYHLVMQDHLAYRYEVLDPLGAGSFGQVVKCLDHKTGHTVAIKLIRNKKRFHAQAMTEVKILKDLVDWDPEDRFHNIRMTDYFYFRNHLCVAFECLSMNLYEFIKSNNFQGFSLGLIRRFTIQILQSLCLLQEHRVIHCDLKPENILLKHPGKSSIKVIDFGSSCAESERVYTYIQSRFYRAPEVILGMAYGMPIDMWSLGCILAELYTGVPVFPGESEQEQLACIMEVIGVPDRYLIERSSRRRLFFDSSCSPRIIPNARGKKRRPGTKSIAQALRCHDRLFVEFIQKCLRWDPERRMRPHDALRHEWIAQSGSLHQSSSSSTTTPHRPKSHSTPKVTSGTDSRHHPHSSVANPPISSTSGTTPTVYSGDKTFTKKNSMVLVDDYYYTNNNNHDSASHKYHL